ncbi:uncharacterized protein LOC133194429 [Saccostrea echinata]|uniref:uncharacterized protein LOC133194429 n=1 Tax=Saccostrea echinata TaxID=191078 RepID=UPI002A8321DA|nr:uncharacterized protein LOC133194429 [Saccostrea echinata]
MAVLSLIFGIYTSCFLFGFTECSHDKYCYYSIAYLYYCEDKCENELETGALIGSIFGGIFGLAIIIGITICVSINIYNKRKTNVQPHNGAIIYHSHTLPHPQGTVHHSIATQQTFRY